MKKIKKRVVCFLLALFIAAWSAMSSYASASVVIGGGVAIGVEYAFAWLLGAVGLTAASVAVYDNADSIKAWGAEQVHDFEDWAEKNVDAYNEWADVTSSDINAWCNKVAKGTVDKASKVWSAFKSWATHLYVVQNSSDIIFQNTVLSEFCGFPVYVNECPSEFSGYVDKIGATPYVITMDQSGDNYSFLYYGDTIEAICLYKLSTSSKEARVEVIFKSGTFKVSLSPLGKFSSSVTANGSVGISKIGCAYVGNIQSVSFGIAPSFVDYFFDGSGLIEQDYSYVGGISDVFDRDGTLDNVDLVGVGSAAGITDVPVVWTNESDLVDALSRVVAGEASWADVLESAGVVVVDLSENTVVDDEGVTDKPIEGIIPPPAPSVPSDLKDYTVDGLSELFPFCLPFDLIDFFNVLSAEPEAPHFTWTFSYPTLDGMKTYDLEIDLSPFNSVAELLRDMECILFVVGLILITRDQMIKG